MSFNKLIELENIPLNQSVNIAGVVIAFTKPKLNTTGASDKYSASYTLIDETLDQKQFVTLNIFGNDISSFPIIATAGNIIQCFKLKKQIHKGAIQLLGNLKKIDYRVYYKKVYPFTGFQPNAETHPELEELIRNNLMEEYLQSFIGPVYGTPTDRWMISTYQSDRKSKTPKDLILSRDEERELKDTLNWADRYFFRNTMSETTALQVSPPSDQFINKVPLHTPLRRIIRNHGIQSDIKRCDVVCMVVRVIIRLVGPSELIIWDGTTDGILPKNLWKSDDEINDSNLLHSSEIDFFHSLHAACLYSNKLNDLHQIPDFHHDIITNSIANIDSVVIKGEPVCFITSDTSNIPIVSNLKSGMWIRVRNVHLDFTSNINVPIPLTTHQIKVAGAIYSDTHITPIFPFYRDAMGVAQTYLQIAKITKDMAISVRNLDNSNISSSEKLKEVPNSSRGHSFTYLASILASVTPSQFCTAARIINYFPNNFDSFVSNISNENITSPSSSLKSTPNSNLSLKRKRGKPKKNHLETNQGYGVTSKSSSSATKNNGPKQLRYMFALRVQDSTASVDVIVYDQEGCHFFGGLTAEEWNSNPNSRRPYINKLKELIDSNAYVELHIRCYVTKDSHGKNMKRLAVHDTSLLDIVTLG